MSATLTGQWKEALKTLTDLSKKSAPIAGQVMMREGLRYQEEMKDRILKQKIVPPPLSEFTLKLRKLRGFAGTKALIVNRDLVGSIKAVPISKGGRLLDVSISTSGQIYGVFAGVNRKARAKKAGKAWAGKLVNVAWVQEKGAGPFYITVTPALRRFWVYLFMNGVVNAPLKRSTTQIGPIRIPARPFVGPVFKAKRRNGPARIKKAVTIELDKLAQKHGARPGGTIS